MRDEIKQTGKYIRDSSERRDIAIRRVAPIIPITDRVRDIFEDTAPANMRFNMPKDDTRVNLDIRFLRLPWNTGSLCGNCHCRTSELFYADTSTFVTAHNFDESSIRVYVNNVRTTNFITTGVNTIELLDSTLDTDVVSITYIYAIEALCDEGTDIPEYSGDVFTGYQRVIPDGPGFTDSAFSNTWAAAHAAGGWNTQETLGPIQANETSSPFKSITALEPMEVRIWYASQFGTVVNPGATATIWLDSSVRGELGRYTIEKTWPGLGAWYSAMSIDLRNYHMAAGETITARGNWTGFLIGGWGNIGAGDTFLMIGRGNIPGPPFVGP